MTARLIQNNPSTLIPKVLFSMTLRMICYVTYYLLCRTYDCLLWRISYIMYLRRTVGAVPFFLVSSRSSTQLGGMQVQVAGVASCVFHSISRQKVSDRTPGAASQHQAVLPAEMTPILYFVLSIFVAIIYATMISTCNLIPEDGSLEARMREHQFCFGMEDYLELASTRDRTQSGLGNVTAGLEALS